MTDTYSYSTTFKLTREHLSECFEQSVVVDNSIMAYKRAIISLVFGIWVLIFKLVSDYLAFFVISLGVLEVFSTYYKKTWWVWRQMFGRSYKSQVTLLIDAQGINNRSEHINETIQWSEISALKKTELGFILHHPKGVNYLSLSYLDSTAIDYVLAQVNLDAED